MDLKWLLENYGTISVVVVMFFGLMTKGWRFFRDAIRTFVLGNHFYTVFGESPAESIKTIHEAIQNAHDTLEIRQQISERYLKIGVFICDLDGKCIWSNSCLNEMFGLDSQSMRGFGWLSPVHISDRKRVHENWMYAVKENIAYTESYTICNERDCLIYSVRAEAVAAVDDEGKTQCYVGYLAVLSKEEGRCK
jgi:PAS domain-containing protein